MASKSWPSPGTYHVRAKARCSIDTNVESDWSTELLVIVIGPDISVSPASVDFGNVSAGSGVEETITVMNSGTGSLQLGMIGVPSTPFNRIGGTCSNNQVLNPGESCFVIISFSPPSAGLFNGSLEIPSDDPDESSVIVYLKGGSTPDLIGEWVALDKVFKESKKGVKCKVKGLFDIQNIGKQDALSSIIKFYLSSDGIYGGQDGPPLKQMATGKIGTGQSRAKKLSASFPLGETLSGKYIIAIIDPDDTIIEANEENNHETYGPIP